VHLATKNIRTLARQSLPEGITLDYTHKRVYWIERRRHIFSSDYDFQHLKSIRNGSFRPYVMAISGDSLYFQNTGGVLSINQMNVSNGKSVRSILVDKAYNDLIVFHSSLQSMGM
jgi:capsid portal protein